MIDSGSNSAHTSIDETGLLILRDDRIIETIATLQFRINERFPGSGLSQLCGQLLDVSRKASDRSAWISRPILWIRVSGYALSVGLIALLVTVFSHAVRTPDAERLAFDDFIQTFDAGLNGAIFISVAIYFLVSLESRIKRRRALAAVHELRSIAHIIDMHQLTKDPERVVGKWAVTEHSPKVQMTAFQLNRYLDYCSEMLALIGKIAALYVQKFDDSDSVAAVSELEQLSTGLSRKIWQKIIATRIVTSDGAERPVFGDGRLVDGSDSGPQQDNVSETASESGGSDKQASQSKIEP